MSLILCHKCSGVLAHTEDDKDHGLNGCQCMSGYVRGFEPSVSRELAATVQAKRELEWMALYVSQGRTVLQIAMRGERLARAMKQSPVFGHGYVNWALLTSTTEGYESDESDG